MMKRRQAQNFCLYLSKLNVGDPHDDPLGPPLAEFPDELDSDGAIGACDQRNLSIDATPSKKKIKKIFILRGFKKTVFK